MKLFEIKPVLPWAEMEAPREDLKTAKSVEQYKVGNHALYIPDRWMSWQYIPFTEIITLITEQIPEEAGDHIEQFTRRRPLVRVMYKGGAEVLYLDHQQNANLLISMIRDRQSVKSH